MGKGRGFGKVILLNEHFTVYGIPSIASAVSHYTEAVIEDTDSGGIVHVDNRDTVDGYKEGKLDHQREAIQRMFEKMNIPQDSNLRITTHGTLFCGSGIGASAAICTAIARAASDHFKLGMDDDQINAIAHEGEFAFAGNPSGVDDTASTYGGLFQFKKGDPPSVDHIKVPEPMFIVMGNTAVIANTKEVVAGVKKRKEEDPKKYDELFSRSQTLVPRAREALEKGDIQALGQIMNNNHELLQAIEVSHPRLDEMVEAARANGALGAKLTGGGRGGYMVALVPDEETQTRVRNALLEVLPSDTKHRERLVFATTIGN